MATMDCSVDYAKDNNGLFMYIPSFGVAAYKLTV